MKLTPIPEKEAAKILGVSIRTVQNAIRRSALVRIPGTSLIQHVAKEQVMLFAGKKRLVLGSLIPDEHKIWQDITDEIVTFKPSSNLVPPQIENKKIEDSGLKPEEASYVGQVTGLSRMLDSGMITPKTFFTQVIAASGTIMSRTNLDVHESRIKIINAS